MVVIVDPSGNEISRPYSYWILKKDEATGVQFIRVRIDLPPHYEGGTYHIKEIFYGETPIGVESTIDYRYFRFNLSERNITKTITIRPQKIDER